MQDASAPSLPGKPILYADVRSLITRSLDNADVAPPPDGGTMVQNAALFDLPGIQLSFTPYLTNSHPDAEDTNYGPMFRDASVFFLPSKPISMPILARSLIAP